MQGDFVARFCPFLVCAGLRGRWQVPVGIGGRRPAGSRPVSWRRTMSRISNRRSRVPQLIADFPQFLQIFIRNPPFTRSG